MYTIKEKPPMILSLNTPSGRGFIKEFFSSLVCIWMSKFWAGNIYPFLSLIFIWSFFKGEFTTCVWMHIQSCILSIISVINFLLPVFDIYLSMKFKSDLSLLCLCCVFTSLFLFSYLFLIHQKYFKYTSQYLDLISIISLIKEQSNNLIQVVPLFLSILFAEIIISVFISLFA